MHINYVFILLDLIGFGVFVKWLLIQYKDYKSLHRNDFFVLYRFKYVFISLIVILIPIFAVNYTDIETIRWSFLGLNNENKHYLYAIILSFLISLIWLKYIIKLDMFDAEKKRYIVLIFVLSMIFTVLSDFPYELAHKLGYINSPTPYKSFLYSVFVIGLIEETIKLIPLLILLKFTKAVDEPYDYIFYASASALGFAFIENTMYLSNYGLTIVSARAFYATVLHMVLSSFIAYGLFLIKYKHIKINAVFIFLFFFLLAIFSHGFYDFWYINIIASQNNWLSTLFLLLLIHLWFSMINNTMNVSNYYSEDKKVSNDKLKVYLINGLLSIFMFSYIYMAFIKNSMEANEFIKTAVLNYGFIIFYIIATLSRYELIKGLMKPIKFSWDFLIPKIKKEK